MVELAFLSAVLLGLFFLRPYSARINSLAIWRPIAALGAISYSLYLIHQFNLAFVGSIAHRLLPSGSPDFIVTAVKIALHIAVAAVFWYLCERPFLRESAWIGPVPAALRDDPKLA